MSKVRVWDYDVSNYVEKESIGKVKYVGESFEDITSDKIYDVLTIEHYNFRIVDDSEEDYLYDIVNPSPRDGSSEGGVWEIVEDETGELTRSFKEFKFGRIICEEK